MAEPLPADWESWDADRLEREVSRHNRLYWDQAAPAISDYDFDRLVEGLRARRPDSPVLEHLGPDPALRAGRPVEHRHPMLSLDKCYDPETLRRWADKFEGDVVMTPKVDGIAASLRYDAKGRLEVAATRGSGTVGEEITANVKRIKGVPARISVDRPVEIRGEVYMPLSVFRTFDGQFANPRNTAAGALKQKDPAKSAAMGLRFLAYDVVGTDAATEEEKFEAAARLGFAPVEHRHMSKDEMVAGYETFVARRAELDYEIDGVVFKADRLDEQARLGSTSHHPRWAIAYKLQGDSARTVLRDVEWSVSRSKIFTPVGIVDPVQLSGATVTRISLHNWGMVKAKGLTLGAEVVAMRRGGVIPYLEAVVEPGDREIVPPERCEIGGEPLRQEGDFIVCTCVLGCRGATVGILSHYAKCVGIEGFGAVWLETLVDAGLLKEPADFYRLQPADLVEFDRMGETLAQKLVDQIQAQRAVPLAVFLAALGVPHLGPSAAQVLARHFRTLEKVRAAAPEDLVELPKFGELLAGKVVAGLADRARHIDDLLAHVAVVPDPGGPEVPAGGPLSGQSFLFTGTLVAMKREDAQARVEALGGKAAAGVSKALTWLVVGDAGKAGSKVDKARGAGVEVIGEARFLELLATAEAARDAGE